jgi:hypothetical protein
MAPHVKAFAILGRLASRGISAKGARFQRNSIGLREAEFFGTKPPGPLNLNGTVGLALARPLQSEKNG